MNTVEFAVDHHSAYFHDGRAQLPRVNQLHKERGFPLSKLGYYVGYTFFIEEDGTIIQTRDLTETGAHSFNCGCRGTDLSGLAPGIINIRSVGICLAGNFEGTPTRKADQPTPAQIRALHGLIMQMHKQFGVAHLLHRETKKTSCPGVNLRALVDEYHVTVDLPEQEASILKALPLLRGARLKRSQRLLRRIAKRLPLNA